MYQEIPRGTYIDKNSPYYETYEKYRTAERNFYLASDLLGIPLDALYQTVRIALRWYVLTGWQKCLPDNDADKLLQCLIKQSARN